MGRLLSLILAPAMCVSLMSCGAAQQAETTVPAEAAKDVVILYTNDVHTYIDGVLSYDIMSVDKIILRGDGNIFFCTKVHNCVGRKMYSTLSKLGATTGSNPSSCLSLFPRVFRTFQKMNWGQTVKKTCPVRTAEFDRNNRIVTGHAQTVFYKTFVTI